MPGKYRKNIIGAILLAFFYLMSSPAGMSEEVARFAFSADPTERVLWMKTVGEDQVSVATVYGDGRLEYTRESQDGTHLDGKTAIILAFEDVRSLVEIALQSGLAEYDESLMKDMVRANPLMSLHHAGKTTIGFSLEYLTDRKDFSIEITCENVNGLTHAYPTVAEFRGIKELQQHLFKYWKSSFEEVGE